jgi:uncharacterized repeat protein (TIGR01451 family)
LHSCKSSKPHGRSVFLALMGTALLVAAAFAPAAQARTEAFQPLASSPAPLTALVLDPTSNLLYAQEDDGEKFFVYDPRTNVWSERAEAPIDSGNNGGAAYLNGKIYVVYTGNADEMSVYDIASNSWTTIENPLEEGTADITAGNGKLYLAISKEFVQLDPATGIATPLADPPNFDSAECDEGFENWGGLVFAGSKIYGHQGNGCAGFAVYDIAANSWTELPLAPKVELEPGDDPESAVLGSAIDPITNTYITAGPYAGKSLFRYDIEAGTWSIATLPFEVEDNGMAYVPLPGYAGVYIIQGEGEGTTGFTRYTERNSADLTPSISAAATHSVKGGSIAYSIQVKNNGPERASGVVLSDPLPAGSKLVSAETSQGTCTATTTVTCNLDLLKSGASASLTIKLQTGFGKVTNTATVTSLASDTNGANDSATAVSNIPRPCVVPKLRGKRLKKAKKALRKAHCKPGKVAHRFSRKVKKGRVIRGAKHRGSKLKTGSKVKLTVSKGPKPVHKTHRNSKAHG